mmetsp:Transcript_9055/g.13433  ORF Transcript_9055/g.13433 Transcript_9055/m.13433 type:complete len:203 (+) Transcript_9055:147-755(+)
MCMTFVKTKMGWSRTETLFSLLLLLEPFSKGSSEGCHDKESTSYNVTKSDRDKIFHEHILDSDLSSSQDSKRNHEHVGNRVVKTKSDEGTNGEPNSSHLSNQRSAAGCHVDSHAHKPVAEDSTDKGNIEWKRALGCGDSDGSWCVSESSGLEGQVSKKKRSNKVTSVRGNPVLCKILLSCLPFSDSGSYKSSVSSEEFATCH